MPIHVKVQENWKRNRLLGLTGGLWRKKVIATGGSASHHLWLEVFRDRSTFRKAYGKNVWVYQIRTLGFSGFALKIEYEGRAPTVAAAKRGAERNIKTVMKVL